MAVTPPAWIQAPPVVAHRFGLFTAATVVDAIGVRERCGVEWEPATAGPATLAASPCPSTPESLAGAEPALAAATPFVVYAGVRCDTSTGRTYSELLTRAQTLLSTGEQAACELALWTGQPGNRPRLADPATVVLGGPGPVSLPTAVGLLEEHLLATCACTGVIHAPRRVSAAMGSASLVARDGGRLVSTVGTPMVFGHTSGIGPAGTVPPAGSVWLYATGQVLVRRGDVHTSAPDAGFEPSTGRPLAVAQRVYVAGFEGVAAAVLAQLP